MLLFAWTSSDIDFSLYDSRHAVLYEEFTWASATAFQCEAAAGLIDFFYICMNG
jgi:hypothetical protein